MGALNADTFRFGNLYATRVARQFASVYKGLHRSERVEGEGGMADAGIVRAIAKGIRGNADRLGWSG